MESYVIEKGPMPTPVKAFFTENMGCDAGIMISAAHNSYQDNGIKFFDGHGDKLRHESERELEEIYGDDEKLEESSSEHWDCT